MVLKNKNNFLGLKLLALVILIPFITPFKHYPLASYHAELLACLLGVIFVMVMAWKKLIVIDYSISVLVFVFSIVIYLTAPDVLGLPLFLGFLLLIAFYNSVIGLVVRFGRESVFTFICWAIFFAALVNSAASVFQLTGWGALRGFFFFNQNTSVPQGQLGQANQLANILFVGVVAGAWLYCCGLLNKFFYVSFLFLLGFVVAYSTSRTIYLYVAGFVIISLFMQVFSRSRLNSVVLRSVIVLFIPVFLVNFLIYNDVSGFQDLNVFGSRNVIDSSSNTRLWLWARAWEVFSENPFFGVGFNRWSGHVFELASLSDIPFSRVVEFGGHSHNLLFQIAAELGLIGIVIVLIFIGIVVYRLRCLASSVKLPVILILWVEFVHSMLEYPLWYFYFLIMFFSIVAVLVNDSVQIARVSSKVSVYLFWIGSVGFSLLVYSLFQYHAIVHYWRSMESSRARNAEFGKVYDFSINPIVRLPAEMTLLKFMSVDAVNSAEKLSLINGLIEYSPYPLVVAKKILILKAMGEDEEATSLEHGLRNLYGLDTSLNPVVDR